MTVERGNLPSSERCGGSRLMVGDNTYTIAPPLRREWPLTCQGLPAPQHNRPPYRSVMRMEWATCVVTETSVTDTIRGLVTGHVMTCTEKTHACEICRYGFNVIDKRVTDLWRVC